MVGEWWRVIWWACKTVGRLRGSTAVQKQLTPAVMTVWLPIMDPEHPAEKAPNLSVSDPMAVQGRFCRRLLIWSQSREAMNGVMVESSSLLALACWAGSEAPAGASAGAGAGV